MSQWNSSFAFTFITIKFDIIFFLAIWYLCLIIGWSGLSLITTSDHIRAFVVIAKRAESPSRKWNVCYEGVASVSRIDSLLTGEVIKFEGFRRRRSRLPTYCVFCDQSALLRLYMGGQLSRNISLHSCIFLFLSRSISFSRASFCHLECSPVSPFITFIGLRPLSSLKSTGVYGRDAIQ